LIGGRTRRQGQQTEQAEMETKHSEQSPKSRVAATSAR
jgi:hypothetical protein